MSSLEGLKLYPGLCVLLSISSPGSLDNTGAEYNVSLILNADSTFNEEAYKAYSPLFLSTTFALSYGLSFASITSTLTHAFLFFRKQIWKQSRRSIGEQPDIHARLMSRYPQVPEWWYAIIFCKSHHSLKFRSKLMLANSGHVRIRSCRHPWMAHRIPCWILHFGTGHLFVYFYSVTWHFMLTLLS